MERALVLLEHRFQAKVIEYALARGFGQAVLEGRLAQHAHGRGGESVAVVRGHELAYVFGHDRVEASHAIAEHRHAAAEGFERGEAEALALTGEQERVGLAQVLAEARELAEKSHGV